MRKTQAPTTLYCISLLYLNCPLLSSWPSCGSVQLRRIIIASPRLFTPSSPASASESALTRTGQDGFGFYHSALLPARSFSPVPSRAEPEPEHVHTSSPIIPTSWWANNYVQRPLGRVGTSN